VATSRIADSVGRVLNGRYRLTRPLGVGASAHVYVAEDVSLRRLVAIKVLHPALAGDEGFLRRFRAESRVVASLRHENILTVYDWGEDHGAPYLVMELLTGGSLRSMMDKGSLLSPAQAAEVGIQASAALDYAHRRGLVHRDIKPANLIFDGEGKVRVADFGLARALAEATWTEPAGAVVGTARYAAPEQAKGRQLDGKADVYSLALVLTEATTGTVPFAADTTLGTLMARIEKPLVVPQQAGPLGPVLEAAGTVDPEARVDAAALGRRLAAAAAKLPAPAALPLAGPLSGRGLEQDLSPTEYPGRPRLFDGAAVDEGPNRNRRGRGTSDSGPGGWVSPNEWIGPDELDDPGDWDDRGGSGDLDDPDQWDGPDQWDEQGDWHDPDGPGRPAAHGDLGGPGEADTFGPDEWPDHDSGRDPAADLAGGTGAPFGPIPGAVRPPTSRVKAGGPEGSTRSGGRVGLLTPRRRRRRRWTRWLVLAFAVLALLAGGAIAVVATGSLVPSHPVPTLVGDTTSQAQLKLRPLHLNLIVTSHAYSSRAARTIVQQVPSGGRLKQGKSVRVVLSLGPKPVPVPHLANLPEATAEAALKAAGLRTAVPVKKASSMTVPAGSVISSTPSGGTLVPGRAVSLTVSTGKPHVPVPGLAGASAASYTAAAAAMNASGLQAVETSDYSNTVPKGSVILTEPPPGTSVVLGSQVTVEVSLGPHLVAVPFVGGDSVTGAAQALEAQGFSVSGVTGNPTAAVSGTSPSGGSEILYGSAVQIVTG
jgi:eukaryotic-like serine/threonine-protein kinase